MRMGERGRDKSIMAGKKWVRNVEVLFFVAFVDAQGPAFVTTSRDVLTQEKVEGRNCFDI